MIIMCSDKETIEKLKKVGFKVFKEAGNYTQFFFDKSIKLNFDKETMLKISITKSMKF